MIHNRSIVNEEKINLRHKNCEIQQFKHFQEIFTFVHCGKSIIAEKPFDLDGKSVFKGIIAKSEQLRIMDDDGEVYENGQVSDF